MEIGEKKSNSTGNVASFEKLAVEGVNEEKLDAQESGNAKIEKIEKNDSEFKKNAEQEFQEICEKHEVPAELMGKYRLKLQAIVEKASIIADIAKHEMSRVIIGASMLLATANAASAGEKYETQKVSAGVSVEMIENTERDRDLRERIGQMAEYIRSQEIDHVESGEYLKKLTIEFKGDENLAKEAQQKRVANLKSVNMIFHVELEKITDVLEGGKAGDKQAAGCYFPGKNEIHVARQHLSLWSTLRHELKHAALNGYRDISNNAKDVLNDTYETQGFFGLFKDANDEYHGDYAERIVRKQTAESNLKKYGENFTKEDYERMMTLYEGQKLAEEEMEFIKRTKPGFENFRKVFDEIAKNEGGQDVENV